MRKLSLSLYFVLLSVVSFSQEVGAAAKAGDAKDSFWVPTLLPQYDHPFAQARGRLSGLMYSLPGSDPNGIPRIRIGGLYTIQQDDAPLVIMNGLPQANPLSIDPAAITEIQLIQDPVELTKLGGLLGGTGALHISTQAVYPDSGIVWRYRNHFTTESRRFKYKTASIETLDDLSPNGILRLGHIDWQDEIVRPAFSMAHHLDGQARSENWRLGGHVSLRDRQGIGRKIEYQQLSLGIHIGTGLLKEKLQIDASLSLFNRNAQHENTAVFTEALLMPPYLPIRLTSDDTDPQVQNLLDLQELAGGYLQTGLFERFNPVAIQDQSELRSEQLVISSGMAVRWDIFDGLRLAVDYAHQVSKADFARRYLRESFYPNRGLQSSMPGSADWDRKDMANHFGNASLTYSKKGSTWQNTITLGIDYQDTRLEQAYQQGLGYADNTFFFSEINSSPETGAANFSSSAYAENHKLLGYYADYTLGWKNTLELRLLGRTATSTRLGDQQGWAFFPAASLKAKWENAFAGETDLHLRLAYGQSGNLPRNTLQIKGERTPNGFPLLDSNPNLGWETRTTYNAGADIHFFRSRAIASMDYYRSFTTDLIYLTSLPTPPSLSQRQHVNLPHLQIENASWQFKLQTHFRLGSLHLQPYLQYSIYRSELSERPGKTSPYIFPTGEDVFSTFLAVVHGGDPFVNEEGLGEIGRIITYQLDQTASDLAGEPVLVDQNGDGMIDHNDQRVVGYGLPIGGFGFGSKVHKNKWALQFLFRGETGHHLAHAARINAEVPRPFSPQPFNLIQTEYYRAAWESFFLFNDYYVEKADYLLLEYLQISHRLDLRLGQRHTTMEIYLMGRNLWLSTPYTGDDPSVRFADQGFSGEKGQTRPYFYDTNPIVAGIDRMGEYPLARSFSLGVNWTF